MITDPDCKLEIPYLMSQLASGQDWWLMNILSVSVGLKLNQKKSVQWRLVMNTFIIIISCRVKQVRMTRTAYYWTYYQTKCYYWLEWKHET